MTDEETVAAAERAAAVQLEDEQPVELEEVDEPGETPFDSWGQNGTGNDIPGGA